MCLCFNHDYLIDSFVNRDANMQRYDPTLGSHQNFEISKTKDRKPEDKQ